jgi:purine-binding chemotaxis protein CheW
MTAIATAPGAQATALQMPLVVTFRVGRQVYALPLATVLQVVRLPALTMVPDAPPAHCGLLNLRGAFLPVLAARSLLGEPELATLDNHVIVLATGEADVPALGLLVDEVDAVRRYQPGSFAALAGSSDLVIGVLRDRDEAAVVLDPEALAARAALAV